MDAADIILTLSVNIYSGIFNIVKLAIIHIVKKDKKIRWGLRERGRLPFVEKDFRGHTVVWLHAASLGESKLLYTFLNILEKKHPKNLHVVTAATASGVEYLNKHKTDSVCAVGFLPYDTISLMRRMIDRFGVSRVWIMETELWPSFLWVCKRRNIPIGIVNARMEEKSFKLYYFFRILLKPLVENFKPVFIQSEKYAERFKAIGVKTDNIVITGNLKRQVKINRPSMNRWKGIRRDMGIDEGAIVITVGCLHAGEESIIHESISRIHKEGKMWKWIIVPRYPKDGDVVCREFGSEIVRIKQGISFREWKVCCIDGYGVMEDMYGIADAAVIGGTFVDVGGHNVWEAAQFGIPVFFGPFHYTQRESCEQLVKANVGFGIKNADDLAKTIVSVLKTDAKKFIDAELAFMEEVNRKAYSFEEMVQ